MNFKKISIIGVIIIITLFIIGSYLLLVQNSFTRNVKNLFPNNLKLFLKETVFIIPNLKKENEILKKKLTILEKDFNKFKITSLINNDKFLGYGLNPIFAKDENQNDIFEIKKFQLSSQPHNWKGYEGVDFYKGRYLEKFKDEIILIDYFKFYKTKIEDLNFEDINLTEIESNIKSFGNIVGLRDAKVVNNKIYISAVTINESDCYNLDILYSNLNSNKLIFEKLFSTNFELCLKGGMQSGGRIDIFDNENLIITIGDFGFLKLKKDSNYIFENNNHIGKIIKVNTLTRKTEVLSKGHRNPQGLIKINNPQLIISTEHGPEGGDEINLNRLDKIYNFGWPVASYGILYNGENPFVSNHKEFGYEEPKKYYIPSIAIGQIIEKNISEKEFLFTSLRSSSIYHIKFDENYNKILFEKKYLFEERIRDILKLKNNYFAVTLDSSPSLGLFYLE